MNRYYFYLLFVLFICFSCGERLDYLEDALRFAGANRTEMEKVLAHYRQNPADSLKYRAAVFLIENMKGHYSYKYPDYLQLYYDELSNSVSLDYSGDANKQIIENISAKYNDNQINEIVWDIQILTSGYIIENIERAFDDWENGEWATHISFDDFCEYLLPYKGSELQPLDNWREYARDMLKSDIDLLNYCDLYKNLAFQAATSVSKEIIGLNRQVYPTGGINSIPIRDIQTIIKMPYGSCEDHTFLALPIMRSKGIPIMEDFTPQWPFQALGHSWNIILNNYGKNMVFSAGTSNPGEPHKPDEKIAKVFRKCYAINREISSIHLAVSSVSTAFNNVYIKDVTNEYMVTHNIEIEIPAKYRNKHKYAYLAVFDNKNWIPVQYGKVNSKKVLFKSMGGNCMYMPVFYGGNGVIPFSSPFYISPDGKIHRFETNKTLTENINIHRKYFIAKHCYGVGVRMQGGRFEAANRADFKDAVLLYKIPNLTVQSGIIKTDTIDTAYRYWRYYSADSAYSNVAELYFFEKDTGRELRGNVIGTKGSYNGNPMCTKEAVFDRDPLTFFDAPKPSDTWVGMDFGEPIKLDHISYTPRGDGNDITPDDTHELLFWSDNRWISLGRKVANDIVLVYENVPVNTIYWIRNHTRGKDERIFTYENGKQIWW